MLKSGTNSKTLTALIAIICFGLGFTTANTIQKTDWLGHLVHGTIATPNDKFNDFKIIPLNNGDTPTPPTSKSSNIYSPSVVDSIVIGLREDGVVVWKKAIGNKEADE